MAIRSLRLPAGIAAAALVAGCSTVSSEHIGQGQVLDTGRDVPFCDMVESEVMTACEKRTEFARRGAAGFAYFLPRQLARVTATRTGGPLEELVQKVVKAQSAIESKKAEIASLKIAIKVTEGELTNPELKDAARPILTTRLAEQKAALDAAKAEVPELETAYKVLEAKLKDAAEAERRAVEQERAALASATAGTTGTTTAGGTAEPAGKPYNVSLKIELLPPSADPAQAFLLSPQHSVLRDDEHKLIVSSAGLLTSTDIVATDRTADILVEIATFAGAISGLGLSATGRTDPDPQNVQKCTLSPNEYSGTVDFADPASIALLNHDLQCLGVRLQASGRYWPGTTRPVPDTRTTEPGIEGIVYRTPVQIQVRIEKCVDPKGNCSPENPQWFTTEVLALSLPQAGPISYVRQDAGFMTKTKYKLAFSDGILTSYDANRPSELLEVARTPMRLVNGVFDGISKVISLRTGQNNALAGLSTSELTALQARFALQNGQIVGQSGLNASQLALLQSQFALQGADLVGQAGLANQQLALLQAQYGLQGGALVGQAGLTNQQLALLQAQYALQAGPLIGQTGLTNQQLALLQAQSGLAVGQNNLAVQQSASGLALTVALLREQARRDALNRCVAEKIQANQAIDGCLAGF